jgi:hypothetical protein
MGIEFNMNYIGPNPKKWVPHKIGGGAYPEDTSGDWENKPVKVELEIYQKCVVVVGGECYELVNQNHFFMKFDNVKWIPYKSQTHPLPVADPCSQQEPKTTMEIRIGSQWVRVGGRWYKIG